MPTRDRGRVIIRLRHRMRNQSLWVLGGVWSQGWNLKELTEGHHQEWSLRLNLTQHGETYQVKTWVGLTDWELFLDSMGGGAWPFLVGGVICLVNSVNERDLILLTSPLVFNWGYFLEGLSDLNWWKFEAITGLWCPYMSWAARALQWHSQQVLSWPGRVSGNLYNKCRVRDRSLEL